jgi:hypothetical protein
LAGRERIIEEKKCHKGSKAQRGTKRMLNVEQGISNDEGAQVGETFYRSNLF